VDENKNQLAASIIGDWGAREKGEGKKLCTQCFVQGRKGKKKKKK